MLYSECEVSDPTCHMQCTICVRTSLQIVYSVQEIVHLFLKISKFHGSKWQMVPFLYHAVPFQFGMEEI